MFVGGCVGLAVLVLVVRVGGGAYAWGEFGLVGLGVWFSFLGWRCEEAV